MSIIGIILIVGAGYFVFYNTSDAETRGTSELVSSDTYIAGAYQLFSQSAYDQAITDGKTVILDFHADWCSTCVQNKPIINEVFNALEDDSIVGFQVDYDIEKALKRTFNISSQSTILKVIGGEKVDQLGPGIVTNALFLAFLKS